MPIYEYACQKCGAQMEVMQKVSDKPLARHGECGGKLEKQWSQTSFQLKGSGWYVTDYAGKKATDGGDKEDKKADAKKDDAKNDTADKDAASKEKSASADAGNESSSTAKNGGNDSSSSNNSDKKGSDKKKSATPAATSTRISKD